MTSIIRGGAGLVDLSGELKRRSRLDGCTVRYQ